jgi:hypothetical protein
LRQALIELQEDVMKRVVINSLVLALLSFLVNARVAFAYIDPNTGGMLFQALATSLAVFTGLALLFSRQIRMLFARARRSLRSAFGREEQQPADSESPSQDIEGE